MKIPKGYIGSFTDEYLAYATLYGDLIYYVPHYFRKRIVNLEDQSVEVITSSGSKMKVWARKGSSLKEQNLI